MKRKQIVVAVIMALTLTTGTVAYAATSLPEKEQTKGEIYQSVISMPSETAQSFDDIDKDNLPDGVQNMDEISMDGEGALPFDDIDKDNLPDGVQYTNEISMVSEGAQSFDDIDTDNLPDGVQYMDKICVDGENVQSLPLNK